MSEPIHIISLGAGVQSSTMALMAAKGEITPMPRCAVFADTQAEPKSVYHWLDWLEKQLPFPVHRVTAGSLTDISTTPKTSLKSGDKYLPHAVPAFVVNPDGSLGKTFRQCTDKHKLAPLRKAILKEIISAAIELHNAGLKVEIGSFVWIGISVDEASRMKDSNHSQIKHRWPLIELGLSRRASLQWMQSNGYGTPPRSSCSYCPYHSDTEWRRLKNDEPEAFEDAVRYERLLQAAFKLMPKLTGTPFLHRTAKSLSEVDFSTEEERGQLNMFENECEGMCGV